MAGSARPVFEYKRHAKKRWLPGSWRPNKKTLLITAGVVGLLLLFFGVKLLLATNRIITRNNTGGAPALAGTIDPTKLKGEGDGRINILLLGVGGPGHQGAYLSDTMMVISIDPRTHDTAILSIPRDLYVPIPGYGSAKINSADSYGEAEKSGNGPALAKQTVSKVLGIDIHYYVQVDFQAFKQSVDKVGGVDVTVDQALYDPEYPCPNNEALMCGFSIKAGKQHLDGATALEYVRCRKGNCGDDFGRAARQQQVMVALRSKAISLGTLANPATVLGLIDIIGDHVRTDLQPFEIKKLLSISQEIDASKITHKVLDDTPEGLLMAGDIPGAGSILVPRAGVGNFKAIQQLVHSIFIDNYIKDENAAIEVQNGTTRSGLATQVGTDLKDTYQYNVVSMTTAENQNYPTTVIYDYTDGKKPYTINYLEQRFGVKAQRATAPSGATADIRIIVGASYKAN
jgi:LCP family protein required for cell wall assembly